MKTRLLRPEENWKSNLTMAVAFEEITTSKKPKKAPLVSAPKKKRGKTPATAASAHF